MMAAQCGNHSHFHKTVHLHEWWLFWAEDENHDKKLAIAGHTSRGQGALRVFSSSPILRRLDVFTLETTDGVYVRILGLVNKSRTEENGFPSEVFKCFFFGFPPHWEVCAKHYLAQGFADNDISREDAVINAAGTTEEKTYKDASLKDCNNASKQSNEMNNNDANVSLASLNQELEGDPTASPILEGSENPNKAIRYISRACGDKDTDQRSNADIEMESNLVENAVIKEASIAEEKICDNVSTEDASLEGCSTAGEQINVFTRTEASVSIPNSELVLDQDHIACMIREGPKDHNEAVRIFTRVRSAKDTDQMKTLDVEKESIMKENTASEGASTTGKKTCTDASRRIKESPKMSDKAVKCRTRSGGARNTDRRRTATVEKENHLIEKAASKETSICKNNTKREFGSPVTPKADVKTSFLSPELSSVKRSRSGRLLLPTLEYWRNQTAVYDAEHQVIGIKDKISIPCRAEVTHEPKRSKGRARSKKDPNAATEKLTHESKRTVGRPRKNLAAAKEFKSSRRR